MRVREGRREDKLKEFPDNDTIELSEGMERFRDEMLAKIEISPTDDDLLQEVYDEQVPPLENVIRTSFIEEVFDDEVDTKKPLMIEEIPGRLLIEEIKDYETITGIETIFETQPVPEQKVNALEGTTPFRQDPKLEAGIVLIEEFKDCETITGFATIIETQPEQQAYALEEVTPFRQDPKLEAISFTSNQKPGFNRNNLPMASIAEVIEEHDDTDYYFSPLEQRRADLELMMEAASASGTDIDETIPLLPKDLDHADCIYDSKELLKNSEDQNLTNIPQKAAISTVLKDDTLVELEIYDEEMLLKAW